MELQNTTSTLNLTCHSCTAATSAAGKARSAGTAVAIGGGSLVLSDFGQFPSSG